MLYLTLLAGAIILNLFVLHNPTFGLIVGLIYLFVYGNKLGKLLFKGAKTIYQRLFGVLIFLCLISISGSLAYYSYKINTAIFVIILISLPLLVKLLARQNKNPDVNQPCIENNRRDAAMPRLYPSIIAYLLTIGACFFLLIHNSTTNAIASPWHVLPKYFFILFGIATIILIKILLTTNVKETLKLFFTIIYFFLFSSVAYFIYKIGFGYDPFVHLATMKHIQQFGTISPTLYYYVGEYSIIIFLANLFQISIEIINKIFLPLLFSIYLPTTLFFIYANKLKPHRYLLPLCALILPVTFFINTTPQGIACLFSLILILTYKLLPTSYPAAGGTPPFGGGKLILSLAACFIHPFFGLPILLFSLYSTFSLANITRPIKIILKIFCAVAAFCAVPLMFVANAIINNKKVALNIPALSDIFNIQSTITKKYFDFIPDLIHAIGFNLTTIFLIASVLGIIVLITKKQIKKYGAPIIFAIIFALNYLAMKFFMQYKFLTPKEVNDYIARIADLSRYFLLPIVLYFCAWLFYELSKNKSILYRAFPVVLILLATTTSLYFSYPIFDNYKNSKFYNVSAADIKTVRYINDKKDYIVLGNQMLAAAALRENGFAKYFGNEFYYSIPNANINGFYKYYLEMAEKQPTRETAIAAMDAAKVDQLYFVISNYWHDFNKTAEKAKTTSNWWHEINNGKNIIFYYQR